MRNRCSSHLHVLFEHPREKFWTDPVNIPKIPTNDVSHLNGYRKILNRRLMAEIWDQYILNRMSCCLQVLQSTCSLYTSWTMTEFLHISLHLMQIEDSDCTCRFLFNQLGCVYVATDYAVIIAVNFFSI